MAKWLCDIGSYGRTFPVMLGSGEQGMTEKRNWYYWILQIERKRDVILTIVTHIVQPIVNWINIEVVYQLTS